MADNNREQSREPVRTTIVGGQPQVRTKAAMPIPEGIEQALSRAAGDARFRSRLLTERAAAVESAGIRLTLGETALLQSVSAAQLEGLIAAAAPVAPPRRHFLQAAAAWVAALFGVGTLASGCARKREPENPGIDGIRPDVPPEPGEQAATEGMRPDMPPERPEPDVTRGIRPDVPEPDQEPPPDQRTMGIRPDVPPKPQPGQPPVTRGIQPDVPKPREAPPPPATKGIRPDIPPAQDE